MYEKGVYESLLSTDSGQRHKNGAPCIVRSPEIHYRICLNAHIMKKDTQRIHMFYGLVLLKHTKISTQKQRADIFGLAKEKKIPMDKFVFSEDKLEISQFKSGDTIVCSAWSCLCKRSFLRGLYEDIRFNFLSHKNTEVVVVRVQNGHELGRRTGSKTVRHILDVKEKSVLEMYESKQSMYAIAKKMGVAVPKELNRLHTTII